MEKSIKTKNMMKAYREYANAEHLYECYPHVEMRKELRDEKRKAFLESSAKVTAQLDEVQKRCTARCITAEEIIKKLCDIEDRLGITKKAMDGIKAEVNINAQTFARAYKYTPDSTCFRAIYKKGQWEITSIYRGICTTYVGYLTLTEEAEKAIIESMRKIQ